MKKLGNVLALLGIVAIVFVVVVTLRFGEYNSRRDREALVQWQMEWASRR